MARQFCAFLLAASSAFLRAQIPETKPQTTVAGTVVDSATGQPLAGALVIANLQPPYSPDEPRPRQIPQQRAVTGAAGRFSFDTTGAIGGTVQASRQGYRSENNVASAMVVLRGDFGNTTVRLVPQGVITGRVLDGDGEALPGMTVEAIRIEIADGRRELRENYARAATDDRGEYRMWNLPPGSYYVKFEGRVSMRNYYTANAAFEFADLAYGPLYYPRAESLDAAQFLKVEPGQTTNAPFTAEGRKAYQIRGRMANAPPHRSFQIRLLRGTEQAASRGAVNMAALTFQVADVVPGSYTLQIYTADGGPLWEGELPVTVGEHDLVGISVGMVTGIEVRGRVQSGQQDIRVVGLLRARRVDPLGIPGAPGEVYAVQGVDGFTFKGLLPGKYEIETNGAAGGYISSIRSGNEDVLADGLTVTSGGAPEIVIEVTPGGGMIKLQMDGVPEEPVPGQSVQLLLVGQNGTARTLQSGQAFGNEGGFRFVAPGDYTLYAWPSSHEVEFRNPVVLDSLSQYATPVKIAEGETKEVTIKPIPPEALP